MTEKDYQKLIEKQASLEHDQWVDWAIQILRSEHISLDRMERWNQFFTDYKNLPEQIKEEDRAYAKKSLLLYKKYLTIKKKEIAKWQDDLKGRFNMCKYNKKVGHDEYFDNLKSGLDGLFQFLMTL